jgi:hypothetical protein
MNTLNTLSIEIYAQGVQVPSFKMIESMIESMNESINE